MIYVNHRAARAIVHACGPTPSAMRRAVGALLGIDHERVAVREAGHEVRLRVAGATDKQLDSTRRFLHWHKPVSAEWTVEP